MAASAAALVAVAAVPVETAMSAGPPGRAYAADATSGSQERSAQGVTVVDAAAVMPIATATIERQSVTRSTRFATVITDAGTVPRSERSGVG